MGKKLAVSHALNLSARKIRFLEAVKDVFESFETHTLKSVSWVGSELRIELESGAVKVIKNVECMSLVDIALEIFVYAPVSLQKNQKWIYALEWLNLVRDEALTLSETPIIPAWYIIDALLDAKEEEMEIFEEPWKAEERRQAEYERKRAKLPCCDRCGLPLDGEDYWEIFDEKWCENCVDACRKSTDEFWEE